MMTLQFDDTHNLVMFLSKPAESKGFEQIVDFLNASPIRYALTINLTIYTSYIEQLWATVKVKTVNGEVQLQALVDGNKIIAAEAYVRRDLQLNDKEGTDCLPNAIIFEELTRIGAKTTVWNEFSSTMASTVICLATNQKFNFSKYIFESMVKNLNNAGKFLMYPRFVQVFLEKQLKGMQSHNRIYVTPSYTKKIFRNIRSVGKGFSGRDTPLFPTMMVQAQQEQGVHTPRSDEDRLKLNELMEVCTKLQQRVLDLENTKTAQAQEITKITLVHETQGRYGDEEMFDTGVLDGDEVLAELEVTVKDVNLSVDEVTLVQALAALKSAKVQEKANVVEEPTVSTRPRAKGLVIHEEEQATTPTVSSQQPSQVKAQNKGKGIMVEEPVKMKKKDQISLNEEIAFKLQAKEEEEEEERLAREKAQREKEANIVS
ncbi:hypothetical protein Tco_0543462 [Tanacetum coccineum]